MKALNQNVNRGHWRTMSSGNVIPPCNRKQAAEFMFGTGAMKENIINRHSIALWGQEAYQGFPWGSFLITDDNWVPSLDPQM